MSLPGFFSLVSAWLFLLVPVLVLFYFLKLKRPRLDVPCLVLWKQVLQDSRVNSPFQRFKRNILLWLQLLLLILLVLAAMQPYWRGDADRAERLPILVDCSASMAALDKSGGISRLDEAKKRVRKMIDGMVSDQRFCLIAFDRTGRKLTDFTDNKRILLDALDTIRVHDVASNVEDALRITKALARREPFDRVLLLSDGNFPGRTDLELAYSLDFQQLPAAGSNIGVTTLNATRTMSSGGEWVVFVTVGASSEQSSSATIELLVDGEVVEAQDITLSADRGQRLAVSLPAETNEAMSVEVRLKPDGFDSLASDNMAYLDLEPPRRVWVYAPIKMRPYRLALQAVDHVKVLPEEGQEDDAAEFDLVISDQPDDMAKLCNTSLLVGAAPKDLEDLVSVDAEEGTSVVDWRRDAPSLRHVELSDLVILDSPHQAEGTIEQDFESRGYEVLAHGEHGPLLLRKDDGARLSLNMLVHSDRSTLPYRVGFPIFVSNMVKIAMRRAGLAETPGRRTGVLPAVKVVPEREYRIRGPGRVEQTMVADKDGMLRGAVAPRVGRYSIKGTGAPPGKIGASLLSTSETSLEPVEQIQFRELSVTASKAEVRTDKSLWQTLAMIALLVLLVEWWYYQRRPGGFSP